MTYDVLTTCKPTVISEATNFSFEPSVITLIITTVSDEDTYGDLYPIGDSRCHKHR
jgi:hypothetical protein